MRSTGANAGDGGSDRSPGNARVPDEGVLRAMRIAGEARRPVILAVWTFFLLLLCSVAFAADDAPRLPCGTAPYPAYADPGAQPNVQVWSNPRVGAPVASDCTGSIAQNFKLFVSLAGSFRNDDSVDKLMERFGAVSATQGNRYWSVTDKEWRVLITHAVALEGADSTRRRRDFTAAEMKDGKDLFFVQSDSRSTNEVVYRMRVQEYGPDRLVIEMENVSPVRFYFFTLFEPAELRSVHFLDRRVGNVWGYYALSATARSQAKGSEVSFVNRAAAFYRYVIGRPTDQDPPLAP